MSFNLREALNGIFMKGKYTVPKDYSQYAINMYLAKYRQYIPVLDQIMRLQLPNEAHFRFLQKKVGWGWPMKIKQDEEEVKKDPYKDYVMRYYECSRLDAESYLKFMSENEKKALKDYYEGVQDEQSSSDR